MQTEIIKVESQIIAGNDPMQRIIDMVLDTVSVRTRPEYKRALTDFMSWYTATGQAGLNKAMINAHITALKQTGVTDSSINQRLAALRKFINEAADNGLIDYATAFAISKIPNIKIGGKKLGNWLTKDQASQMLNSPDVTTLKGKRDRAVLAVMLGGGLRRDEVSNLTVEHLQQREGRWVILDLKSKHNSTRTVPINAWVKVMIDNWLHSAGIYSGYVFRAFRKGDRLQAGQMHTQAIWDIVKAYAPVDDLAPHDLRRTFAKLSTKAGAPIAQVQKTLGHKSIQTTELYLGTDQDLVKAPSDYLEFDLSG